MAQPIRRPSPRRARRGGASTGTAAAAPPDPLAAVAPFRACAEAPGAKLGQGAFGVVYAPQFLDCARHASPDLVRACPAPADSAPQDADSGAGRTTAAAAACPPLSETCARDTVAKAFVSDSEFGYEIKAVRRVLRLFKDRLALTALRPDVRACGAFLRLGARARAGEEAPARALMYRRFDGDVYALLRREDLPTREFMDALLAATRAFLRFCQVIHPSTLHVDSKLENMLYRRAPGGGVEVVVSDYGMLAPTRDVGEDGTPPLMSPLLSLKVHDRHGTGSLERQRRELWALADPFLAVYSAYSKLRDAYVRRDLSRLSVPGVVDFHAMGASMLYVAGRMRSATQHLDIKRALLLEVAKLLLLSAAPGTAGDPDAGQRLRALDALEPRLRAHVDALSSRTTAAAAEQRTRGAVEWWRGTAASAQQTARLRSRRSATRESSGGVR